jgi:formate hydrogenlyase subunit 6/NADH:ubiquinone oxidoreductase subunit I
MSLFDLIGAANELANLVNQPVLTVDVKRCVHAKNKTSTCRTCLDACPVGAISLDTHQIALDASRCVQCGHCLHTCPTGAFTGVDGVEKLLDTVKPLPHGRVIEIACPHHPQEDTRLADAQHKIISTRCLAAYSLSTYTALKAIGVKKIILRLDACAQCPLAELQKGIMQTAEQANALLNGSEQVVVPVTQVTEADLLEHPAQRSANKAVSRRELFQMFRKPLDKPMTEVVNAPKPVSIDEITFDERVPQERVRLVRALRQLGDAVPQGTYTPFIALKASTDCTACGICAFACPTHALKIEWGDKEFALNFASGACTNCSLCTELCPIKTLSFDEPVPVEQAVTLEPKTVISGPLQRCRKCNAPFAAAEPTELCPLCEYHRRFPFGRSMKAERNHG